MVCSYCGDESHNILLCTIDNDLDKMLYSTIEPDFNKMELKILKKIGTLVGLKSSFSKFQYVVMLKKFWLRNKNQREKEVKELQEQLTLLRMTNEKEVESCPICMEDIGVDSCTTKCGHKYCSSCFSVMLLSKNSCACCRGEIIDKKSYAKYKPEPIEVDLGGNLDLYMNYIPEMPSNNEGQNSVERIQMLEQQNVFVTDNFIRNEMVANEMTMDEMTMDEITMDTEDRIVGLVGGVTIDQYGLVGEMTIDELNTEETVIPEIIPTEIPYDIPPTTVTIRNGNMVETSYVVSYGFDTGSHETISVADRTFMNLTSNN